MVNGKIAGVWTVEAYEQYGSHESISTVYLVNGEVEVTMKPDQKVVGQRYNTRSQCMMVNLDRKVG